MFQNINIFILYLHLSDMNKKIDKYNSIYNNVLAFRDGNTTYNLFDKSAILNEFWNRELEKSKKILLNYKNIKLPLARIKRLMKVEEDVKIIAQEVPILFALTTEKFIEEITLRAWIHTKEGKRKILQKPDICKAIKTTHMYDFLINICENNIN